MAVSIWQRAKTALKVATALKSPLLRLRVTAGGFMLPVFQAQEHVGITNPCIENALLLLLLFYLQFLAIRWQTLRNALLNLRLTSHNPMLFPDRVAQVNRLVTYGQRCAENQFWCEVPVDKRSNPLKTEFRCVTVSLEDTDSLSCFHMLKICVCVVNGPCLGNKMELLTFPVTHMQLECEQWIAIGAPMPGSDSPGFGSTADTTEDVNDEKTVRVLLAHKVTPPYLR